MLYTAGDIERALATLAQALEAAEAAGVACGARPDPGSAGRNPRHSGAGNAGALRGMRRRGRSLLESGDDLEGMADAWLLVGKLHFWRW